METQAVALDASEAERLYREYRAHQHYSTPIDREIQRAYRLISKGRIVIRALESVRAAGLGADNLPKLAIGRADKPVCCLHDDGDGGATFADRRWRRATDTSMRFAFPAGSFPGLRVPPGRWSVEAQAPLIPLHLRPKTALDTYHLLWEAEWRRVPPRDPLLLRRIGQADLWLVVAAWDLTDVEYAALSTRVRDA